MATLRDVERAERSTRKRLLALDADLDSISSHLGSSSCEDGGAVEQTLGSESRVLRAALADDDDERAWADGLRARAEEQCRTRAGRAELAAANALTASDVDVADGRGGVAVARAVHRALLYRVEKRAAHVVHPTPCTYPSTRCTAA